ncbi:hypothetical protein ABW20_dc0106973 [Dactylellina cionopaga]|nr:hypothetical protein ABW20_dc0106973 [Dactylellina cionopaga]
MDDYIISSKSLNLGFAIRSHHNFDENGVKGEVSRISGNLTPGSLPASRSLTPSPNRGSKPKPKSPIPLASDATEVAEDEFDDDFDPADMILPTHHIIPVGPSQTFSLKTHPTVSVSILPRNHTVPSVGFLFTQTSNRLKSQYRSLAGPELKSLRQQGAEITYKHLSPIMAFLGDGDHTSLLGDPEWLVGNEEKGSSPCPVVITECSFLYEAHRAQSEKTKHTLWSDLEPIVRRHSGTVWVLMHFSRRYSDEDIVKFFEELAEREEGCPQNIVVWVDGGNEVTEKVGKMMH